MNDDIESMIQDVDLEPVDDFTDAMKSKKDDEKPHRLDLLEAGYFDNISRESFKVVYTALNPLNFLSYNQRLIVQDYLKNGQVLYGHADSTKLWFESAKDEFLTLLASYDEQVLYEKRHTIFNIFEQTFWTRKGKIDLHKFSNFCYLNKIQNILYSDAKVLVKINGRLVEKITTADVIMFAKAWVKDYQNYCKTCPFLVPLETWELDRLFEGLAKHETATTILTLNCIKIKFLADTKDKIFLPFQNLVLEVTKDAIKENKDSSYFWSSWQIKHKLDMLKYSKKGQGDFFKFLRNIATNEDNLFSAIGYMISTYKNPANPRCLVLGEVGEEIDEVAGGSGKSLITQALSHVRNTIFLSGQRWNPYKNFLFQRVKIDTQIVILDDVKKSFRFDDLLDTLSNGIILEEKNKQETHLKSEQSPKMGLTTNFPVVGTDDSHTRRRLDVEISHFYNAKHRPIDDFKRLFFSPDWKNKDWQDFYFTVIYCCQSYLSKDTVLIDQAVISRRAVKMEVGEDLASVLDSILETDKTYTIELLQAKMRETTGKLVSANLLARKANKYYTALNYKVTVNRVVANGEKIRKYTISEGAKNVS